MKHGTLGFLLFVVVCGLMALPASAGTRHSAGASAAATHLPGGMVLSRASAGSPFRPSLVPAGERRGPSKFSCFSEPCDNTPLSYHGGPVMHTNTIYAIYWMPSGSTMTSAYRSIITGFFQNVAAMSGATENVYPVAQQYSDHSGHVQYSSTFGGAYVDTTHAIPANDCGTQYADYFDPNVPPGSLAPAGCVTEQDEMNEVQAAMDANGWTAAPTHMFMLFTPQNTGSCIDDGSDPGDPNLGVCSYTYYCGYHDFFPASGGGTAIWANLSYPTLPGVPSFYCDAGEHPNGDEADAVLSVTSHEHNEAITDPQLNAWWENGTGPDRGAENGDKCAWNFGTPLGTSGGADYNQQIGSGQYFLQQEWSNAGTHCLLREPQQKIAIKTYTASGVTGGAVTITGSQFQDATDLQVNGVSWPYTMVNTSTITTTVPAGATSGKFTLVDPPLGNVQSSNTFKVLPHITTASVSQGVPGMPVTLTGTSFLGATVKFGSVIDTTAVVTDTGISTHVPATAVAGPLTVTTTGGVASTPFTVEPTLDPLSSSSGLAGSTLTLTGTTLGTTSKVSFGSPTALATIKTKSPTAVTVTVPTTGVTGTVTLTLAGGGSATAGPFTVLPKLSSFSPVSGIAGSHVSINGTGLANTDSVQFNGVDAASFTATATKIDAVVPATATRGTITVDTHDGTPTQLIGSFSPLPKVTLLPAVHAGDPAVITGTNLTNAVLTFGGHTLTYSGGDATSITTDALASIAVTGPLKITTTAGSTTVTLGVLPTITNVAPLSGLAGALVTISGNTLKSPTSVTFGTGTAKGTIKSSAAGTITVTVPTNAVTGAITVTNSAGSTASAQTFHVLPRITSFSPTSASHTSTTLVKIHGSGLDGAIDVQFGTTDQPTFTQVSATEVDARIPAGLSTGLIALHITTGDGTADSTPTFKVT